MKLFTAALGTKTNFLATAGDETYGMEGGKLPSRVLADEGDPVSGFERGLKRVGHPEDRVVDHHLDVFAQGLLRRVPQRRVQLRMASRQALEDATHGLAGRKKLLELLAARPRATHKLRDPGNDFHRTTEGFERAQRPLPQRSLTSQSRPSFLRVSGLGLPVFRSYPTHSYQVSSIFSHWSTLACPLAGPSTGVDP